MDEADMAEARMEAEDEIRMKRVRLAAQAIPKGMPGVCRLCEEESPRLVRGACARCRDRFKLG